MSEIFDGEPGDDVDVPPGMTEEEAYRHRLFIRLSRDADRQMREADDANRAALIEAFAEEQRLVREAEAAAEREAAARATREAIADADRRAAELAQLNSVSVFGTKH